MSTSARTAPAPTILAIEVRFHRTGPAYFAQIETTIPVSSAPRGTLNLSKLAGESGWTIDAAFGPNGYPFHVNGFGARFCITHKVNAEITAQLDTAAEAL